MTPLRSSIDSLLNRTRFTSYRVYSTIKAVLRRSRLGLEQALEKYEVPTYESLDRLRSTANPN